MPTKIFTNSGGGGGLEVVGCDDGCVPGGAVIGREVGSGGVSHRCPIVLVRSLGGNAVV